MSEQLLSHRCPVCTWAGETDRDTCPECGHGLVEFDLVILDD